MIRGFEKRPDYVRCCLDSVDQQVACELYRRGDAEWCDYNAFGRDDICRCQKAKEILLNERAASREVTL
jgi:hypothetical protein